MPTQLAAWLFVPRTGAPARKACHCSQIFLRRTLHLFRFLKTFIVKTYPTRQTKTGIAPPFSL